MSAMAEVVPLKTMGTVGGKERENRKVSKPPMATPMRVTTRIWMIDAAPTTGLEDPMALSTPMALSVAGPPICRGLETTWNARHQRGRGHNGSYHMSIRPG